MTDISTMYTKDRNMKTGRKGCSKERRQQNGKNERSGNYAG